MFLKKAGEREILWVMRIGIFLVTALATLMGLTIKSVYGLWFLCSDLVYVVLFPQLFCVVYFKRTNTYGSMVAYWTGIILRLLAGESLFGIRPVIKYPLFDEELDMQKFPFRTTSMLVSFVLNISVSLFTQFIFENEYLSKKWDIFQCVTNIPIEAIALKESTTADEFSKLNVSNLNNAKYSFNQINEIEDPCKTNEKK